MPCTVCNEAGPILFCSRCRDNLRCSFEFVELPPAEFAGARFPLGRLILTWGAVIALEEAHQQPTVLFSRHARGDWGALLGDDDLERNEEALREHERILSKFSDLAGTHYYVITEHDRSSTTILLPEEY